MSLTGSRGGVGGPTRTVWALLALHVTLLMAYGLLSPMLQAPDEDAHADMALSVLELSGYPEPGQRQVNRQVISSRNASGYNKEAYDRDPADAPPRPRVPLGAIADDRPSRAPNNASQHPPLYYVGSGLVVGVIVGAVSPVVTLAHDQVMLVLRGVNMLLLVPLPLLAFAATRRLGGSFRGGEVAAAATLAIPQLHYIGAAVNNDNAVVFGFGVLSYGLARVLTGDRSMGTALVIGLVSAVTSLSKVFGLVTIPWIALTYAMAARPRSTRSAFLKSGMVATSAAASLGMSWYVGNVLRYGRIQPMLTERSPAPGFAPSLVDWLDGYPPRIMQSFWGNFGYLDVGIAGWMVVAATVAAVGATVVAVIARSSPWPRRIMLLVPVVLIIGGNAFQHWTTNYPRSGGFAGSQGRYLFGIVVPAAVLLGLALRHRSRAWGALVVLLAGVGVLQVVAVGTLAAGFWGLEHGAGHAFSNVLAWSPLARPLTVVVLLLPIAAVGCTLVEVWRTRLDSGSA